MMKRLILFGLMALLYGSVSAQKTQVYDLPDKYYADAVELFRKDLYSDAIELFETYIPLSKDEVLKQNSEFYIAAAATALGNTSGPEKLEQFVEKYPQHSKNAYANFLLGRHHYNNEHWGSVARYLKKGSDEGLTYDESVEYHFMLGYAYFKQNKFEEAYAELYIIRSEKTKYYYPANYYLGYTCMKLNKTDEALTFFNNCKGSKIYASEIPLYVAQIYFSKKQYDFLIAYTDTISTANHLGEIKYIRGKAFYHKQQFDKALPLLESFKPTADQLTAEDHYMLGYTYLKADNCQKAYPEFAEVYQPKDTITQYAYFNSGQCFMKLDMKTNARSAFQQASLFNYDAKIKQEALMHYAKLSYEQGFTPEALSAFKEYAQKYPESPEADDAKTYQSEVLLQTNNYKEAIEVLESVRVMNEKSQQVYQQITYYRALQLLDEKTAQTSVAKTYLVKSLRYYFDRELGAKAHFWLGEIAYREDDYDECIRNCRKFAEYGNASELDEYAGYLYNLAYAYLKKKEYSTAANWFEQYKRKDLYYGKYPERYMDVVERLADCFFTLKRYEAAMENYDYVYDKRGPSADYAGFQKGIIQGLLGNKNGKISTLKKIPNQFPHSVYVDDALYEIAQVNYELNQLDEALKGFQVLISEHPKGVYASKCHLKSGIIYYQSNRNAQAKTELEYVIENYKRSPDAGEASKTLEEIYREEGKLEDFFAYIKDKGTINYSQGYQDSVTYESALDKYQQRDCNAAIKAMQNYLQKFPSGNFVIEANYYAADCYYKEKNLDDALPYFLKVLESPRAEFIELSLRNTATIYYLKKDYSSALPYYKKLEQAALSKDNILVSLFGQMRCHNELKQADETEAVCKKLLAFDKVTKDGIIEANLYLARTYLLKENLNDAEKSAAEVVKNTKNQQAAEARYIQATVEYKRNELDKSTDIVVDITKNYASYDYWKAKALLLQSDIFVAKSDKFNAHAILNGIINGYKVADDGIVDEARAKLELIP